MAGRAIYTKCPRCGNMTVGVDSNSLDDEPGTRLVCIDDECEYTEFIPSSRS